MARKRIMRVKLGGNWLSQIGDKELTFSMEESKALEIRTTALQRIIDRILKDDHGLENYKILNSYE